MHTKNNQKNINIISISLDKKNLKTFYNVSFYIYKDNPWWVPPFFKEMKDFFNKNNIFWEHSECQLFIAVKNKKIIGRIAAIIDHKYCQSVNKKIGYFGFFECIKNYKCAEKLFSSVQNWLLSKNMEVMRGPIDGRIDVGCGFLLKGFNFQPSLLSTYTPRYYISFVEKFKMKKIRDFVTYHIDLKKPIPFLLKEKAKICAESGITIRPFNRLRTQNELKWWTKIFLETFKEHWGYVPVSAEEVKSRYGVKQLRWIVDTKLFLIAEYQGSPVGFIWSTPDYNQIFKKMNGRLGPYQLIKFLFGKKQINKGKMHYIGIKKDFRNRNIGSLLNYSALIEMKRRGYSNVEVGLIDEKNKFPHILIAQTGAKPYKRYRVFEKNI